MPNYNKVFLTEEALLDILKQLGIVIGYDTNSVWVLYCPFHSNHDSPALCISKDSPYKWLCQNQKCGKKGNIFSLITKLGYDQQEAKRMLGPGQVEPDWLLDQIDKLLDEPVEQESEWIVEDPLRFYKEDLENNFRARKYLLGRGVSVEAYKHFRMGYSKQKDSAVIPILDHMYKWVGVVGRSIEEKHYLYSRGTPRAKCIWNLNEAKQHSELVITEGVLDAVALYQTGIQNVGAIFGSFISKGQLELIHKYFDSVCWWGDNDEAGLALRDAIFESCKSLQCYTVQYPKGIKDPPQLNPEQIRSMYTERVLMLNI